MDYERKYLKYKLKYLQLKQLGGTIISNESINGFVSQLKKLTDNKLNIFVLTNGESKIILIGEDHDLMNIFFEENSDSLERVVDTIMRFSEENDIDILTEESEKKYEETDHKIWDDFIESHDLKYSISSDLLRDKSVISSLIDTKSEHVKGLDAREEIYTLQHDHAFLSNFINTIGTQFGDYSENQESNNYVTKSIINQLDTIIIRRLVVYLVKNSEKYSSNPIIKSNYDKLLDDIVRKWKHFIEYVKRFQSLYNPENIGKSRGRPRVNINFLEEIFYSLSAPILDLNIIKHIIVSDKKAFIVYTGLAHTENIFRILLENGYEVLAD
jgi:hypothetical protein